MPPNVLSPETPGHLQRPFVSCFGEKVHHESRKATGALIEHNFPSDIIMRNLLKSHYDVIYLFIFHYSCKCLSHGRELNTLSQASDFAQCQERVRKGSGPQPDWELQRSHPTSPEWRLGSSICHSNPINPNFAHSGHARLYCPDIRLKTEEIMVNLSQDSGEGFSLRRSNGKPWHSDPHS